jgi:hypothetical protein
MFKDDRDREDVSELSKEEVHAADVSLIKKLLTYELNDNQHDAFSDMSVRLQRSAVATLSEKQRHWAQEVLDQWEPQYLNDFSAGNIPRGKEVVLNTGPKPLRPPTRRSSP